jgi:hypothetical protein
MATSWNVITGPKVTQGVWTHLAGTYDLASQTMTFYVDGQVVGQRWGIPFQPNYDQPLHIGAGATQQPGASHCFFHGRIRGIQILGNALQAAEIQSLAAKPSLDNSTSVQASAISTHLSCDGRGDFVDIPLAASLNPSQFTVSCWVNLRGGQGTWRSVITSRDDSLKAGYSIYAGDNNRWQFWLGAGTGWFMLNGPDVALHTWTFLSATYDGNTMQLYVNGELAAQRKGKYVANLAYPLRIGAGATEGNPAYFFPGQITEVRVWNRAGSQNEIQNQMYCRLLGQEPGLVGYWPFNEGYGTIVRDQTSNGNHGTIPGYVEIPYVASLNPHQFTLSCWVNVQDRQGTWRSAITSRDDHPQRGYILYAGQDNKWQFWLGSGEEGWSVISGSAVTLNTRTFLAATYNGSQMKLYVNGELVAERTANYFANLARPLRIGAGATEGNPAYFFPGQISEVRIWNRACTKEEIRGEMNSLTVGYSPGLVGYWPIKEGLGITVLDETSNANHGTLKRATRERSIGLEFTSSYQTVKLAGGVW